MATLLKLVRNLTLVVAIFVRVMIMSSFAEEIVLDVDTIMPPQSRGSTYVIGDIDANVTIDVSSPNLTFTTFHSIPWTAPRSGRVLIIWHHPGVNIKQTGVGPEGHLGFAVALDGEQSSVGNLRVASTVGRFHSGGLFYFPCYEVFDTGEVTQGNVYSIDLQYVAIGLTDLEVSLENGPGEGSIIEIEYANRRFSPPI